MLNTYKNDDTLLNSSDIGKIYPPYKKTYYFEGDFINNNHKFYSTCPKRNNILIDTGIFGWLRSEDALKIYEMGYFSSGDILELGCYGGLSTSILSRANRDSGMKKQVYTDDLDGAVVDVAKNNLTKLNLDENVIFHVNDATKLILSFISNNKKFGFVFIDHSHEYQPVYNVCKNLDKLMVPGSFCLFHDYNDSRNLDMNDKDYGVYQAVNDGLDERTFEFYGIFGCTVLFRKRLK